MLQRIPAYFFPRHFAGTDDDHRRARIIVNSVLLTSLFSLNYVALSWWADFPPGVYNLLTTFVLFLLLLLVFKSGLINYQTTGYIFNILVAQAVFICGYYQGGFSSEQLAWTAVQPLLATFLLGRTGGLVSLALSTVLLLIVWYLDYNGIPVPHMLADKYRLLFRLNVIFGLMLIVVVIALVFYDTNTRAVALVEEKNDLLRRRSDELQQTLNNLHATQNQLVQKEKMASLGELTAGIAHEIQNPLNFVNNFADISAELVAELGDEYRNPDRDPELETELLGSLEQNLRKITQHGNRAASIVRGMLEHSRTSTGAQEPTDLNALADEFLRLSYHGMRAKDQAFNAQLITDFDTNLGLVTVAGQDIGRVMLNLFNNAFYSVYQKQQHAPGTYQPTIMVSTNRTDHAIQIRVLDNGIGISPVVRDKIFHPFFTTKPTGEGTGLGLSLSYDIVTKGHGGTLTVATREGESAEFTVELPLV